MITIALDVMGGDVGADVVLPAAQAVLAKRKDINIVLVGSKDTIEQHSFFPSLQATNQVSVQASTQIVEMDEAPAQALRGKKDSSMRVAINLVKSGDAQACVSAGNTGALMATAKFVLKTLPGIDRPAICTAIPALQGHTHMLDLGANVDCSAKHLYQFAVMGAALASAVDNIASPRVGVLNIGAEDMKGTESVRQAAQLIDESSLNYIGFVEANEIFAERADVVVCDGFTGNVCLKATEGVAKMIAHFLRDEFSAGWWQKLSGLTAWPVLSRFKKRADPRNYNGATFLGLNGIVIKSHGGADVVAFSNAIEIAILEVQKDVPSRIKALLENHFLETA